LLKTRTCHKQSKKREETNQPDCQWINKEDNRLAKVATRKQEST
jgi:hypothetical protein